MSASRQRQQAILICVCLAVLIAAVYWPVGHAGFLNYDDDEYVTANPHVRGGLTVPGVVWAFTACHASNWHPLTWLSHALDCECFGMNAGGHHAVSVLLHAVNTVVLFLVWRRMTGATWRSAGVAALFGVHPLHVESVAWVSERKDVLSTCFWLLTMWGYVRYVEQPSGWRYLLALGLYTLGLMAKPMVVTLPFVLLLLDYWPLGRTRWAKSAAIENVSTPPSQLIKEKLPFLALGAVSGALTYWAQRGGGAMASLVGVPMGMRIANALLSYVGYISKTFWPVGLAVFYPLPAGLSMAAVIIAGVGLVGITAAVIWWARRGPWFVTGWFWYLGTLVPVIGLVRVGAQSMADRYTYVPSIGLFILLCWSVPGRAMKRQSMKVITCVAAGAALAVCMALSRVQVRYWKDSETLFRHALDVTRDNWLAHNSLGNALMESGRLPEAIEHLEQALRIDPDYAQAHNNLGNALMGSGRLPEAIEHLEQALRINPDSAEAHCSLGAALERAGRLQDAIGHYEQALRIKPDLAEAHYNLGTALGRVGRVGEAIEHLEQALRIKPDYAEAHTNLGITLGQAGRIPEAIEHLERALRIKPDLTPAKNALARLQARQ